MSVPLHFATALLPDGWRENVRITLQGRVIASVAAGVTPAPDDERHSIGLPGIANVHSHAFQRAMAGLAEHANPGPDDFWTWREAMYRVALSVTPDDVEVIAAFLYAEMLEAGFTRVGEFHYLHHDRDGRPYADIAEMATRVLAAGFETGIGMTLLPTFYAHGDFGGAPSSEGQRRFICDLQGFARLLDASRVAAAMLGGATIGIAPHSLRAVAPDELKALQALAPEGPVHIHAAEQVKEVEASLAWSGQRPVEWLLANAGVDDRWCLIHATHMNAAETAAVAASGAGVGLCPITEANLGDGIFNGRAFLAAGGSFGIGTDSNVFVDAAAELRQLEYAQRLGERARNRMTAANKSTGRALFDLGLAGGAKALGQAAPGLQAGSAADIVTLRADHPMLEGRRGDRLLDAWIFAAQDRPIDTVWAGGVKQVIDGRHRLREALQARFRALMRRLLE